MEVCIIISPHPQSADDLDELLSVEGIKVLKMMCYKNLDNLAKDKNETGILSRFMKRASEVGLSIAEFIDYF